MPASISTPYGSTIGRALSCSPLRTYGGSQVPALVGDIVCRRGVHPSVKVLVVNMLPTRR